MALERLTAQHAHGDNPDLAHDDFYGYSVAPFAHPGIGNLVFVPRFVTPAYNFFGNDVLAPAYFNPLQSPQIYARHATAESGIGGLQAGQMMLQPLYDINSENDRTTSS